MKESKQQACPADESLATNNANTESCPDSSGTPIRLAILQRACTGYRLGLFRKLAALTGLQTRLFIGEDIPNSKVRSTADLSGVDNVRLPTRFFRIGGRVFVDHRGLGKALADFRPDVILCEGESNLLSFLKAIWYCRKHKKTALIHWSLGTIPGSAVSVNSFLSRLKFFFQKNSDAFLSYSSFGKDYLTKLGHSPDKIFVATNVADTAGHLEKASQMPESPSEARAKLGIPEGFTVFYVGTMEEGKRPGLLLDLAGRLDPAKYNFVLLGNGPLLEELRSRIKFMNLDNVFLPGHVRDELLLYYRAASVMVLPGCGGMVISEAMAWSLPVVVHQADGTEYDLVHNGVTGFRLENGEAEDFREAIECIRDNPEKAKEMGKAAKDLLLEQFTGEHMVNQIRKAIVFACAEKYTSP